MSDILHFTPLYQDRVWGGRALERRLGRTLPPGRPVGESWEVVDRPEAQSVVSHGPWKGLTLRQVLERHGSAVMGPRYDPARPFPLLVKWLDCRERLSLQVHPPAEIAPALRGEPKTENWFIAAAEPGSGLLVGLQRSTTRAQFAKALVEQTLEACVHRFEVSAGDSILVRSGTVHAIDGGNLILEIQQNSDTTYRVYDWGRVGLDGKARQLHVAESLASIDWGVVEPVPVRAAAHPAVIADAEEFRIRRVPLGGDESLHIGAYEQPRLLSVVSGALTAASGDALPTGSNVVLPYDTAFRFSAKGPTLVLVTENFI
ncbi:MAG: class I mannose-6-phosphate isomerase [Opitutaceae bacterium]|nr:class I mannose-6-phosphate isomerase [Opitutaceae bacterium]